MAKAKSSQSWELITRVCILNPDLVIPVRPYHPTPCCRRRPCRLQNSPPKPRRISCKDQQQQSRSGPKHFPRPTSLNTARPRIDNTQYTQTMRCHLLTVLASLAATVVADVKFSSPVAGQSIAGGTSFTVKWADDGTAPTIDQFSTYTLLLVAGGNTAATSV
jgi:hypothetical protein